MRQDGFQFKHQRILEMREHQQKQLEIELARVDRAIHMQRQERQRWEGVRRDLLSQLGRARNAGDLLQAGRCADYLGHVRARIKHFSELEAQMSQEREQVRSTLEDVMRSLKMLQNYRDRLRREFRAEHEKTEDKVLDLHSTHKYIQSEADR